MAQDVIFSISGPVITTKNTRSFALLEMVYVGKAGFVGEVIAINDDSTVIQVYEDTAGLQVGEEVRGSGAPLSVQLGPGILSAVFDGIQRPLKAIEAQSGAFILPGLHPANLDEETLWDVSITVSVGDELRGGDIIATCPETAGILHKSMVPPLLSGRVVWTAQDGQYTVTQPILRIEDAQKKEHTLFLAQSWPIKTPRPITRYTPIERPLITGQRVIDTLFPIAKGGTAALPGGFGTGKTMTQHQLAKWSDAHIVVYVGCGERGNEMTQVLEEFGELVDPKNGRPMSERTILIANTSNMPVAAREASIYTGITLAEYYRDMGYDVALMADSTSRWAEALREVSARLEEMPAEEGFPSYLPSRLAGFYERAGCTLNLNGTSGSISIIGAVSPQGADFSEPVTQNTKRFVRAFLALDRSLAYARHYPAIDWNLSYSEYSDALDKYYALNVGADWQKMRGEILSLLSEESRLQEIVRLIGPDVLPDEQKLTLNLARVVRSGFLQQNAYHKVDTFVPLEKQLAMMQVIVYLKNTCTKLLNEGGFTDDIRKTGIFERIIQIKYDTSNDDLHIFSEYCAEIDKMANTLLSLVPPNISTKHQLTSEQST